MLLAALPPLLASPNVTVAGLARIDGTRGFHLRPAAPVTARGRPPRWRLPPGTQALPMGQPRPSAAAVAAAEPNASSLRAGVKADPTGMSIAAEWPGSKIFKAEPLDFGVLLSALLMTHAVFMQKSASDELEPNPVLKDAYGYSRDHFLPPATRRAAEASRDAANWLQTVSAAFAVWQIRNIAVREGEWQPLVDGRPQRMLPPGAPLSASAVFEQYTVPLLALLSEALLYLAYALNHPAASGTWSMATWLRDEDEKHIRRDGVWSPLNFLHTVVYRSPRGALFFLVGGLFCLLALATTFLQAPQPLAVPPPPEGYTARWGVFGAVADALHRAGVGDRDEARSRSRVVVLTTALGGAALAMLATVLLTAGSTLFGTMALRPAGAQEKWLIPPDDPNQPLLRDTGGKPFEEQPASCARRSGTLRGAMALRRDDQEPICRRGPDAPIKCDTRSPFAYAEICDMCYKECEQAIHDELAPLVSWQRCEDNPSSEPLAKLTGVGHKDGEKGVTICGPQIVPMVGGTDLMPRDECGGVDGAGLLTWHLLALYAKDRQQGDGIKRTKELLERQRSPLLYLTVNQMMTEGVKLPSPTVRQAQADRERGDGGPHPVGSFLEVSGAGPAVVRTRIPPGGTPGSTMAVQGPDGQQHTVTVPPGKKAGDIWEVELPPLGAIGMPAPQLPVAVPEPPAPVGLPVAAGTPVGNVPVGIPLPVAAGLPVDHVPMGIPLHAGAAATDGGGAVDVDATLAFAGFRVTPIDRIPMADVANYVIRVQPTDPRLSDEDVAANLEVLRLWHEKLIAEAHDALIKRTRNLYVYCVRNQYEPDTADLDKESGSRLVYPTMVHVPYGEHHPCRTSAKPTQTPAWQWWRSGQGETEAMAWAGRGYTRALQGYQSGRGEPPLGATLPLGYDPNEDLCPIVRGWWRDVENSIVPTLPGVDLGNVVDADASARAKGGGLGFLKKLFGLAGTIPPPSYNPAAAPAMSNFHGNPRARQKPDKPPTEKEVSPRGDPLTLVASALVFVLDFVYARGMVDFMPELLGGLVLLLLLLCLLCCGLGGTGNRMLAATETSPWFGLQAEFLAQAKLAASEAAPDKFDKKFPSLAYEVWTREAATGFSYNGFPLDGKHRPCHPAYDRGGPARNGAKQPDGAKYYKEMCCKSAETKKVVKQYHTIFGLPGWCDDEKYLKWEPKEELPSEEPKKKKKGGAAGGGPMAHILAT